LEFEELFIQSIDDREKQKQKFYSFTWTTFAFRSFRWFFRSRCDRIFDDIQWGW